MGWRGISAVALVIISSTFMASRSVLYLALFLFLSVNSLSLRHDAYTHVLCSGIAGDRERGEMGSDQLLQMYIGSTSNLSRRVDRTLNRRSQACVLGPAIRSCTWTFQITRTSRVCLARNSGVLTRTC
jgi:hypothetical protein